MAQVCTSSPTLTNTQVSNSQSFGTTLQTSVVTIPGSTITSIYTTCATSPNTTTCLTSTTLIPQQAVVSTQIVTLTNTVNVPVTVLATLYGSSCKTVSSTTPSTPSTPTNPNYTPSTDSTTLTPTTAPTITTTSYSTFTGTSLVTSDGSTFTSYYTSVSSTLAVSSSSDGTFYTPIFTSTTSTLSGLTTDPLQTNQTVANSPTPGNNTGAIVGGTLGGIAALGLLALLTWHMIKKSRRFDNIFNKDDDKNYYGPPPKTPPINPYQYGLVGQQDTQAAGFSPPGSPGLQHANLVNEMGSITNALGNDPGALHANANAQLGIGSSGNEVGMQGGSTGNDVAYHAPNQAPVHHIRNPSAVPLLVGATSAVVGGAAVSSHTRPNTSSSRASVASDPLGPLVTHAAPSQGMGYPPQQFNSYPPALQAYAQQQALGQPQAQPQQNLAHNTSFGSSTTFSASAAGSGSGSNPATFVPVGAGSVSRRPTSTISQQSQLMRYDDPFARTGSPIAYQDRQVLHVINAEPSNSFVEGSSSFGTPGLSVSGSSMSTDGKGRPLNMGGEKALLVHLDGGAYEERPRTPAPPAYME